MENNEQVVQPQVEQAQEIEITLDDSGEVSPDLLKAELAKKEVALKQLTARAKAAEAKLKDLKPEVKQETVSSNNQQQIDEQIDLRLDGYSKDEVAFIVQNGGRKSLENPFVKTAIASMRSQRKAEEASPEIDGAKSEIERKYTNDQLSKMSSEELAKILPHSSR